MTRKRARHEKEEEDQTAKAITLCEVCKNRVYGGTYGKFENEKCFHVGCFTCSICRVFLNESSVQLREEKLYCPAHAIYYPGNQPVAMVFYRWMSYRVVYSQKKLEADERARQAAMSNDSVDEEHQHNEEDVN